MSILDKYNSITSIIKELHLHRIAQDDFNEEFNDQSINEIRQEFWEMYLVLLMINEVIKEEAD